MGSLEALAQLRAGRAGTAAQLQQLASLSADASEGEARGWAPQGEGPSAQACRTQPLQPGCMHDASGSPCNSWGAGHSNHVSQPPHRAAMRVPPPHAPPPAAAAWPGGLEPHAPEVAAAVLEAARAYTDHKLERALMLFARAAAKRGPAFTRALASGLVKSTSTRSGQLGKHEMFMLLGLTRVAVDCLDAEAAKKAMAKLLQAQVALADALTPLLSWKVRGGGAWGQPAPWQHCPGKRARCHLPPLHAAHRLWSHARRPLLRPLPRRSFHACCRRRRATPRPARP